MFTKKAILGSFLAIWFAMSGQAFADDNLASEIHANKEKCLTEKNGTSCFQTAQEHTMGRVLEKSEPKTLEFYVLACEYGQFWGCQNAGQAYEQLGGNENLALAKKLFKRGCENGIALSCWKAN